MRKKRAARTLISILMTLIFTVISAFSPLAVQAKASDNIDAAENVWINTAVKYLSLNDNKSDTYNFDVIDLDHKKDTAYQWYVQTDKESPEVVTIDKKTGLVTAKEVGTAYIYCKITRGDGTVLKPKARVIVRNNITGAMISNLPANMTITAGTAMDFDRTIVSTKAGKGRNSTGITRWEIAEDTSGVESADNKGIVLPTKEGEFKIRAVAFQSKAKYQLWLKDKKLNEKYITAASEWQTIKVVSSEGKAVVNTQEQLKKALGSNNFTEITLSSQEAVTFDISQGEYPAVSLIVDTPNADVNNHALFQNITVKAVKDTTWIEYANGNSIYLSDTQATIVIDSRAEIKQIIIDSANAVMNFEINGRVDKISVLQPSGITFTGSSTDIPVTIEEKAGGSTITASLPLKLTLNSNAEIIVNQGAEGSTIAKGKSSVEAKIDNKSAKAVEVTSLQGLVETINSGATAISTPATTPVSSGYELPTGNIASPTGITLFPKTLILPVTGGALTVIAAEITPENAADTEITWSSGDETVATVDENGIVTPVSYGTTPIIASIGDVVGVATVMVTDSATAASGGVLDVVKPTGAGASIALALAKGAASYAGGQCMGWGLKESGLGFKDTTAEAVDNMMYDLHELNTKIDRLGEQIQGLENQLIISEYDIRIGQMLELISHIDRIREDIDIYLKETDPAAIERDKARIHAAIEDKLLDNDDIIHNQLVGLAGAKPLLKVWSQVIKGSHRFLSSEDSAMISNIYDYFELEQTSLLEIQVEYWHEMGEEGDHHPHIDNLLSNYNLHMEQQKALMLPSIPEKTLIDTK